MADTPGVLFRSDFSLASAGGFANPMTAGGDLIYGATAGAAVRLANGSSGQLLRSSGSTAAPVWSYPPLSCWSGYHGGVWEWTTTSATFADFTPAIGGAFQARQSNGFPTVSTAGGTLPGISFTPPSNAAMYFVSVNVTFYDGTATAQDSIRLYDGTNVIATASNHRGSLAGMVPLSGIWYPNTASPITLKLQGLFTNNAGSGAAAINTNSNVNSSTIEWTLVRIN